jgi:hypothetical protein
MPSRRRSANKNLGNNLSDVQRRIRYLERRPARSRLGAKSVTTEAIGAEVITPEQVNFGTVVVGSPGDITDPKDGQLVVNPNDGSVSVYDDNNGAFIDVGDPAAFDLSVTAFAAANTAITTANGKNKITYSLAAPGTTANTAGDIWWQYTSGNIISGQWTGLGGTSWQANTIGNAVVANLDAGKITTGFLDAARINAGTITATMIASTALDAKTITGSTIRTSAGPNSRVIFDTSGIRAINASGTTTVNISSDGSASFTGAVTASSFSGTNVISGGSLVDGTITNTQIGSLSASKINAGTINAAVITVSNLNADNISAGTITSRAIDNGNGTFKVTAAGAMTCSSASITGTINATSGYIGSATDGWRFSSSGSIANVGSSTILYPSSGFSPYAIITDRAIAANRGYQTQGWGIQGGNSFLFSQGSLAPGFLNTGGGPTAFDLIYDLGSSSIRWGVARAGSFLTTSDVRTKNDIQDATLGLNFIKKIRPVSFLINKGRVDASNAVKDEDGNIDPETVVVVPGRRKHYGFIAQEVKEVLDELSNTPDMDFAGWSLAEKDDPDSQQALAYDEFIAPLVKAVQELSARLETLENK